MPLPTFTHDPQTDTLVIRLTAAATFGSGVQLYPFVNSEIEGAGPVDWGVSGDGRLVLVILGAVSRNVPAPVLRNTNVELSIAWVRNRPGQVFVPLFPDAPTVVANRWATQVPGLPALVYTATARSGRIVGLAIDDARQLLELDFLTDVVGPEPGPV